jgi:hypothetical protein
MLKSSVVFDKVQKFRKKYPGKSLEAAFKELKVTPSAYYYALRKSRGLAKGARTTSVIDVPYVEASKAIVILCNQSELKSVLRSLE